MRRQYLFFLDSKFLLPLNFDSPPPMRSCIAEGPIRLECFNENDCKVSGLLNYSFVDSQNANFIPNIFY